MIQLTEVAGLDLASSSRQIIRARRQPVGRVEVVPMVSGSVKSNELVVFSYLFKWYVSE